MTARESFNKTMDDIYEETRQETHGFTPAIERAMKEYALIVVTEALEKYEAKMRELIISKLE